MLSYIEYSESVSNIGLTKKGKLAMYESMKKSVISVFDDGLLSATNTS